MINLIAAMIVIASGMNVYGEKIDLYNERGTVCPETTQGRALYTVPDESVREGVPKTTEGCWMWYGTQDDDEVAISFVDGARFVVKRKSLTWAKHARGSCN